MIFNHLWLRDWVKEERNETRRKRKRSYFFKPTYFRRWEQKYAPEEKIICPTWHWLMTLPVISAIFHHWPCLSWWCTDLGHFMNILDSFVFRKYKGCEIVGWASKKTYGYDGNKSGENKHFKWGENDESCMCVRDELLHRRNSSAGQESGSNWRAGLLQSRVISKRWGKVINKMENLAHELDDQNQHRCPLACVNSGGGPEFVWELKG